MMTARTLRRQIKGIAVSPGIALGYTKVIHPGEVGVAEIQIPQSRVQQEIEALDAAVAKTVAELNRLRDVAGRQMTSPVAKIFDAQLLIAGDHEFLKQVKEEISARKRNAAFVYQDLVEKTAQPLKQSTEPYMRQMAAEIHGVAQRILSHLGGDAPTAEDTVFLRDTILVGQNFTPGEVLGYRKSRVVGFLAAEGGRNSHMALIARSLMTPVVLVEGACTVAIPDGRMILDGSSGLIILNPTDDEWAEYQRLKKRQGPAIITRIKKLETIPPVTSDGVAVSIAANLELPGPVDDILAERRIPVGLYRTEFLYLQSSDFPDEETQYEYYQQIADTFASTSVILRTFDIGSDKIRAQDSVLHEDNPALGWRGIRSMIETPDVFKAQIRAMLRASERKNLKIMLPMVSDLSEYERARRLIAQAMLELRRRRLGFDEEIQVGIMVEVPSAALMAEVFAPRVDFMSIGTNDLAQYTLSADRCNAQVAGLYSPYHPSVLRLIKMTVDACKKHDKQVSICGEVAGDPLALPLFVGMGVEQLSMNPTKIYDLCRQVQRIDFGLVRLLANAVMASSSVLAVTRKLENFRDALE